MTVELYTDHFGFTEPPFKLSPDPDFIFWSDAHKRAFSVLEYGLITCAPLTVITGEVGTGKTTLVQALLRNVPDNLTVGLISNASGGRGDLLRWVLNALDVSTTHTDDYVTLFQRFQDFVINEYGDGRRVLLIIDEAQNLSVELLEELRMLTNMNSNKDELLQILLLGQPELRNIISTQELRQFSQRVSATYHINPMDLATTRKYVLHRLLHAGGSGREFSPQSVTAIHKAALGVPRVINKICDLALVYAAGAGQSAVTIRTIKELMGDGLIMPTKLPTYYLVNRIDVPRDAAE